jgi:internalin A
MVIISMTKIIIDQNGSGINLQIEEGHLKLDALKDIHNISNIQNLSDLIELTSLELNGPFTSIIGLEELPNLKKLTLSGLSIGINKIKETLSKLSNLEILSLNDIDLKEIPIISGLEEINALSFGNCNLKSLLNINKYPTLEKLTVVANPLQSINSEVFHLKNLKELRLHHNRIVNISILHEIRTFPQNLKILALNSNAIRSINGIENLQSLDTIFLEENQIRDISPLLNLPKIKSFFLQKNKIEITPPIHGLKNLYKINLQDNLLREVDSIYDLPNLQILNLYRNQIKVFPKLMNLPKLEQILMSDNQILSLKNLTNLPSIHELDLSYNQISNLLPLENLKTLLMLNLEYNNISDISPLCNLNELWKLNLGNNQIKRIDPIPNLVHLDTIDLRNNKIENLKGFESLKLEYCNLKGNPLSTDEFLKYHRIK